ncbi:hypothetical protein B0H11DRAFT_2204618 [Mycena galericulata]|nr:hypothetical protein B0H11DRAFT_2204618 [Mycena galericulata]
MYCYESIGRFGGHTGYNQGLFQKWYIYLLKGNKVKAGERVADCGYFRGAFTPIELTNYLQVWNYLLSYLLYAARKRGLEGGLCDFGVQLPAASDRKKAGLEFTQFSASEVDDVAESASRRQWENTLHPDSGCKSRNLPTSPRVVGLCTKTKLAIIGYGAYANRDQGWDGILVGSIVSERANAQAPPPVDTNTEARGTKMDGKGEWPTG